MQHTIVKKTVLIEKLEVYDNQDPKTFDHERHTPRTWEYNTESEIPIRVEIMEGRGHVICLDESKALEKFSSAGALISRACEIEPGIIRENAWQLSTKEVERLAKDNDLFVASDKEDAIEELAMDGLMFLVPDHANDRKAGNLWRDECIELITKLANQEGWNTIYERLRALNPMAV